jgi:hypothetical protein
MIRTYKLDDINFAFSDSASGETVKPVVATRQAPLAARTGIVPLPSASKCRGDTKWRC